MRTALKVMSIIAIVVGSLAILGAAEGGTDAGYSFIGGSMFLAQGILSLVYMSKHK